jgi:hypothetical protein
MLRRAGRPASTNAGRCPPTEPHLTYPAARHAAATSPTYLPPRAATTAKGTTTAERAIQQHEHRSTPRTHTRPSSIFNFNFDLAVASPQRGPFPLPQYLQNYRCCGAGSHALSPRTNRRTRTICALECTSFIGTIITITIVIHQQKTTSTTSTATHHNHNDSFPQSHIVGARSKTQQRRRKEVSQNFQALRALPLPQSRLNKTTAPRIPMWSPTMVLTERHSG